MTPLQDYGYATSLCSNGRPISLHWFAVAVLAKIAFEVMGKVGKLLYMSVPLRFPVELSLLGGLDVTAS